MNTAVPERAKFHHMKDGTADDWMIIGADTMPIVSRMWIFRSGSGAMVIRYLVNSSRLTGSILQSREMLR